MSFDLARESDKLLMLLYGLIAFVVVVGGLILLLDVVPTWVEKRHLFWPTVRARSRRLRARFHRRAARTRSRLERRRAARQPPRSGAGRLLDLPFDLLGAVLARVERRRTLRRPPRAWWQRLRAGFARLTTQQRSWRERRRLRRRRTEGRLALFFLLPALLFLGVGLVVPAVRTTGLSFMNGAADSWVGLANYHWMFAQEDIRRVLLNTLTWVVLVPLSATVIGLVYAVLVDRARFESIAKSLIFMPMAISFVGASIIWKFVYAYRGEGEEQIGLLNQIVVSLGGEPRQWLLDPPLNTVLLIVIMVWIQAGFAMVILSAAIKAIPADIIEAARLDGVNPWQMFWWVTMPSIRPALIVVVVTISIATLKVFDIVRTSTNGLYDTSVIANEMYNQAFRYGQIGQGSALAVFLFVLVIPIVIYQIRNLRQQREG